MLEGNWLPVGKAEATIAELASRLEERAASLRLPDFAGRPERATAARDKVIAIVSERSEAFQKT